jgi:hypothetical protein
VQESRRCNGPTWLSTKGFAMRQTETDLLSEMREQLTFETLLVEISTCFVNLPADKIDGEIEDAHRRICECIGLDISALWQVLGEIPRNYVLTHNYRLLEDPPLPERMTADE